MKLKLSKGSEKLISQITSCCQGWWHNEANLREKDRYRFERDVQILVSVNAPKKLLNQCTSNWAVLCCKSPFQPFPYQANWLACKTGVRFSGERRQLSPKPERMQARRERGEPLRGMSGAECKKTIVCGQGVVFFCVFPVAFVWRFSLSLRACLRSPAKTRKK